LWETNKNILFFKIYFHQPTVINLNHQIYSVGMADIRRSLMVALTLLCTILCISKTIAQEQPKQYQSYIDYIQQYKSIAITEMERTGIPASIKLAQGLLESNAGKSTLAREANNHFGIKCGNDWSGSTYHIEDDDFDGE